MRGLEEIRKVNENPHAFHGESNEREQYGNAPRYLGGDDRPWDGTASHARVKNAEGHASHETLQRILEDITGGRPKDAADATADLFRELLVTDRKKSNDKDAAEAVLGLFALAALLDTMGVPAAASFAKPRTLADRPRQHADARRAKAEHLGMDGILSAIDAEPPFLKFWQKLNDERAARGQPEAGYKTAREAFTGGPTPEGALTFIGKKWDGLRAIPANENYHGEFRQVTEDGTVWHVVSDRDGPRTYTTPETALRDAMRARDHAEAHKS